ncbi:alpha/beta hydrolase-fold protein [Pullulanibacillus sp. KACC 23026]|uniref:alpha/beta hydrolase n=1 Tax=Pullulanibacillus sp. KACC 23026 TaxID=3028315 RepID=UPI0023B020BB|nr:alpha/beta hydrolase-fold protein [Pullulanibacillus sp. KACC 23026]WEG11899.1 alpha/beta hydrolase-fold protein [Pullulanibacillus sp. KACC 23026]
MSNAQIQDHAIPSKELDEVISTRLYLPPNYSPLYTYPLIIAQDGPDYFDLGRLGTTLNQLLNENELEKVIVCGIPYPDPLTRWHRYHPEGDHHEAYLRFLHRELLPSLRRDFAVETLASGVTLMGDSLGATVSLLAALTYPQSFGNLILQSPFINTTLLNRIEKGLPSTLTVYHSVGRNETEVKTTLGKVENFFTANQALAKHLSQNTISSYSYVEHDGVHTWSSWQEDLKKALLHLFPRS